MLGAVGRVGLVGAVGRVGGDRRPGGGGGGPPAPSNTVAPAITGTPTQGQTLTVSNGTWTGSPSAYARQWLRDGVDIPGATASTYGLQPADVGGLIACRVTATNAGGSTAATSAAVGPVAANPVPVNTVAPAITGTPTEGQTLSGSNGTWTNSPTGYARQWLRDGVAISGATGASYALQAADVGKMITFRVTASNANGAGAPATSAAVGPVAVNPADNQPDPISIADINGYSAGTTYSTSRTFTVSGINVPVQLDMSRSSASQTGPLTTNRCDIYVNNVLMQQLGPVPGAVRSITVNNGDVVRLEFIVASSGGETALADYYHNIYNATRAGEHISSTYVFVRLEG